MKHTNTKVYLDYTLHKIFLCYCVPATNHLLQDSWQYKLKIKPYGDTR